MARLSDDEKQELLRATKAPTGSESPPAEVREPRRRPLSPREFVEFATFASRFDRSRKPVAFGGNHWKL